MCMFADFLTMDLPLEFTQEHITACRKRIALSLLVRKLKLEGQSLADYPRKMDSIMSV